MDPIITSLANLGFGGLITAAFVYIHWHTLKITIPQLIDSFRAEQKEQRDLHDKHVTSILERLEAIETTIASRTFPVSDKKPRP